jgi:hypothetical protein
MVPVPFFVAAVIKVVLAYVYMQLKSPARGQSPPDGMVQGFQELQSGFLLLGSSARCQSHYWLENVQQCYILPCDATWSVRNYRRFQARQYLHLKGRRVSRKRKMQSNTLLSTSFLPVSFITLRLWRWSQTYATIHVRHIPEDISTNSQDLQSSKTRVSLNNWGKL